MRRQIMNNNRTHYRRLLTTIGTGPKSVLVGLGAFQVVLVLAMPADPPLSRLVTLVIPVLCGTSYLVFHWSLYNYLRTTGIQHLARFRIMFLWTGLTLSALWLFSAAMGALTAPPWSLSAGMRVQEYCPLVHTLLGTSAAGWWASAMYILALSIFGLPRPGSFHRSPAAAAPGPTWISTLILVGMCIVYLFAFSYLQIASYLGVPESVSAILWTTIAGGSLVHSYLDCRRADSQARVLGSIHHKKTAMA